MVSMGTELKIDPELEKCLPPLPEVQYQKLRASIEKKYDPAKPIVLWKERPNTIVDGHHRYKICQELGIEPTTVDESFASLDDAVLYTLQRQIEQRNLTADQLIHIAEQAMSIEERLEMERVAKENLKTNIGNQNRAMPSVQWTEGIESASVSKQIADKANVGQRTVERLNFVRKNAAPEIVDKIYSGEFSSRAGIDLVKALPDKDKQANLLKDGGIKAVKDAVLIARQEDAAKRASQKESEELKKFNEFNKTVAEKTVDVQRKMAKVFAASGGGCLMPNLSEMWCDDCRWGFDVYLPVPSDPCCPYCAGTNVTKRDPEWNSREAMLK